MNYGGLTEVQKTGTDDIGENYFNNQSDQRTSVSTSMATDWQNITEHPSNRRVRIVAVARSSSSSRLVQQVIVQLDGS